MTIRALTVAAAACFALAAPAMACSDNPASPAPAPSDDGGVAESGVVAVEGGGPAGPRTVTLTTRAPASSASPGGLVTAPWVATADGAGNWQALTAATPGSYAFSVAAASWAVALVCGDAAGTSSTVAVYERTNATATLDITLDPDCSLAAAPAAPISGVVTGAGFELHTLDYGYALDHGSVTVYGDIDTGACCYFTLPSVVHATWDMFFALRDGNGAASRLAIVRGFDGARSSISLDLANDMFAAGSKTAILHGGGDAASISAAVYYTGSGQNGVAVGPTTISAPKPEVTFAYATVPDARTAPADRYVFTAQAATAGNAHVRTLYASFHTATTIEATLPALLASPEIKMVATEPYPRLGYTIAGRGADSSYDVTYEVKPNLLTHRRWRSSRDAALGPSATIPDLSAAPGWKQDWALPSAGSISVSVSVSELPTALSDGTLTRITAATSTFTH